MQYLSVPRLLRSAFSAETLAEGMHLSCRGIPLCIVVLIFASNSRVGFVLP